MLSRYKMYLYSRPSDDPLPDGIRRDTRYGTKHILRPSEAIVTVYLANPTEAAWRTFRKEYLAILKERFREDRTPFDKLAALAMKKNIFLGCNCPTKKNPVVGHCHTYLALDFMKKKYPELEVVIPETSPEGQRIDTQSNMYAEAKTWNPFKGCRFDCVYCTPSFQKQSKRQKHLCQKCYEYAPHCHEDRLTGSIPSTPIVFVAGNADISFCPRGFIQSIIERIIQNSRQSQRPKTFYLQSKKPKCFEPFVSELPDNVVLVTTLETNRDAGYRAISKAPRPSVRYRQFKALDYPRKVITIEPVLDFDLRTFAAWIRGIRPEYVWLGFNSKPESVTVPEPPEDKVQRFANQLVDAGIEVRGKTLRGVKLRLTGPNAIR